MVSHFGLLLAPDQGRQVLILIVMDNGLSHVNFLKGTEMSI